MRDYEDCKPYIDHLLAEHRRLHRLIHQTRRSIVESGGPDGDATFANVAQILMRLRNELEHHFAQEESGGCLDEAVSRCPRLSAEANRLEKEHPQHLAELDRLISQAADCQCHAENRVTLQRDFENLCRRLHAHERAENELLVQAFGTSVNGDENGEPTLSLDV
jgi:iron-sulfur cluster repair protein YtfE (RIC family)